MVRWSRPIRFQPIGGAELRKPRTDAVIITWGTMVRVALEAAQLLESEGLRVGVLDLRWLAPLDEETIRSAATRANGKVVVAHEANVTGGFGAEIVARLHELSENRAPLKIKRVGTPNVRIPATPSLSQELLPNAKCIADAVRAVVK
jgi:2-oxoisovalerate dehydrogenase E1 component